MRNRKPNRKKGYDYSSNGWYYITIVTKDRINHFGKIVNGQMILNEYGLIVQKYFNEINDHFHYAIVDEFVIMPNHIHGIIQIDNYVGGDGDVVSVWNAIWETVEDADLRPLRRSIRKTNHPDRTKMKLSKIIHGFKSSVTRTINRKHINYKFAWQRSYHDHIIRDENDYKRIKIYIRNNPINWGKDTNKKTLA